MRFITRHTGKIMLLCSVNLILLLPMLQDIFTIDKYITPLHGSFTHEKDTTFTWQGWFSGGYQEQKEKFLRDSFGLHNHYVRLNNQVNFNLYRKAGAVYVVVGKENYLYETGYFDAFFGTDFVGRQKADSLIDGLLQAQQTMRKNGKLLLPVFAPGKASFYPEYIPDEYKTTNSVSNYLYLSQALRHRKIEHIDFNAHFIGLKHRSAYPLYPQYGIHWSNYGALIAFDSLVHFIESRIHRDLPEIAFTDIRVTNELENTDDDIIKGMNLLVNPSTFPMAYPSWQVHFDEQKHSKPKLLVIADSFWWYIYGTGLPGALFSSDRFWFYNELMYPESFTSAQYAKSSDYQAAIREADVILVLHSESTLARFGCGIFTMINESFETP